jgi:hypothetical protein
LLYSFLLFEIRRLESKKQRTTRSSRGSEEGSPPSSLCLLGLPPAPFHLFCSLARQSITPVCGSDLSALVQLEYLHASRTARCFAPIIQSGLPLLEVLALDDVSVRPVLVAARGRMASSRGLAVCYSTYESFDGRQPLQPPLTPADLDCEIKKRKLRDEARLNSLRPAQQHAATEARASEWGGERERGGRRCTGVELASRLARHAERRLGGGGGGGGRRG